jgi:hypothetical protein
MLDLLIQDKIVEINQMISSLTILHIPLEDNLEDTVFKYLEIQQQIKYKHATRHQLLSLTNAGIKVLLVLTLEAQLYSRT